MLEREVLELVTGFGGPPAVLEREFVELIVTARSGIALEVFLQINSEVFAGEAPSACDYLRSTLQTGVPFVAAWTPAFAALEAPGGDPIRKLNAACWALARAGFPGTWRVPEASASSVRLGRWRLPLTRGEQISVEAKRISALGQVWEFDLIAGAPDTAASSEVLSDMMVEGVTIRVTGLDEDEPLSALAQLALDPAEIDQAVQAHRDGITLLTKYAPDQAAYVRRLLTTVVPLRAANGEINSGSSSAAPGVIHASIGCPVESYAEMLVHECSHQHFYALTRLGPVHDGSDSTLYFSPVKQTGRPIEMILLAYHAFANVVLMGRAVEQAGYLSERDYFRRNEAFLMPILGKLREGLQTSRALTELGTRLWEPLDRQLYGT